MGSGSPPPPRRPVPPRCLQADLASPQSPLPRSEPLFAAGRTSPASPHSHLCLACPSSVSPSSLRAMVTCRGLRASLSVRGVGRPHCFSDSCVPSRLASPAPASSLPSFVSGSAHPGLPLPPPAASLPVSAPRSLPATAGLLLGPRASGAPLGASPSPRLSRAFPAPAPSARAPQTPSPAK